MSNPYISPVLTGYNENPPPDDGSSVEANRISWSKHILKIGNPIKTFSESINSSVSAAFGSVLFNDVIQVSSDYTVVLADRGKLVVVSGALPRTVTLLDAATATSGFQIGVLNLTTKIVTVTGVNPINGQSSHLIPPAGGLLVVSDGTIWSGPFQSSASSVLHGTVVASRSLVKADGGVLLRSTASAAVTLTIDLDTTTAYPDGFTVGLSVFGAGTVTLAGAAGVTLNWHNFNGVTTGNRTLTTGAMVVVSQVSANEWDVFGTVNVA